MSSGSPAGLKGKLMECHFVSRCNLACIRMSSAHPAASMNSISPRCDSASFSTSSRQRSAYQGCFSNNVFITETVRGLSFSRIRYAIAPVTMCVEVFQADAEQAKKEHDNRGIHNK